MVESLERICALICVYNEERETIRGLIKRTKNYVDEVIVVDDGSTQNITKVIGETADYVISHRKNLGKNMALNSGFNFFLKNNYGAIITIDGDGQHLPEEIPLFIRKLEQGYDVVVGKRDFRKREVPLPRKLGNMLDSWILSNIIKEDIYDAQCGFRAFKRKAIELLYKKFSDLYRSYCYEQEIILTLIKEKINICWIDITTI